MNLITFSPIDKYRRVQFVVYAGGNQQDHFTVGDGDVYASGGNAANAQ